MIDVPGHLNWSTFSRIDKEREDSEMTLVVTLAFRNRVVDSYSCFSSHLVGFTLSCLKAILVDLCGFCLVWLRPRFVLFCCFPGDLRVVAVAMFWLKHDVPRL